MNTDSRKPKIINVDNFSISYLEQGQGPPVILLHGLGMSSSTWRFNLDELSKYFNVYALDLPGFGRSLKPKEWDYSLQGHTECVKKFMDALRIPRVHLIGHSYGGAVAAVFHLHYPERLDRLVLISAVGFQEPKMFRRLKNPLLRRIYCSLLKRSTWQMYGGFPYETSRVSREPVEESTEIMKHPEDKDAFRSVVRSLDFSALQQLVEQSIMDIPVLLITGENDYSIRREELCHFAAWNPAAKCVIIPNSRHCPHEEQPEHVNRQIISFCRQSARMEREVSR